MKNSIEDTNLYLPHYCILEVAIRECQEVCESAKIYFGELSVLNSKRKYIPYTDEQLAKMKGVGLRTIKRWHIELEKAGFIIRKTKNVLTPDKKCQWKKERRIYLNQNPKLKIEIDPDEGLEDEVDQEIQDDSNNVFERAKVGPSHERAKNGPSDERAKNGPISNKSLNETKNNNREPSAVAVFSCLKDVDVPKNEKEWITKNFTEEEVCRAVSYCKSPTVSFKTSLIQTLKWACKVQPEIPMSKDPEDIRKCNHESVMKKIGDINGKHILSRKGVSIRVDILSSCVELICGTKTYQCFDLCKKNCIEELKRSFIEIFPNAEKRFSC